VTPLYGAACSLRSPLFHQKAIDSIRHVYIKEQFVIAPLSACVLHIQLEGQSMPSYCVFINPVELPIQRFTTISSCRSFESHWKAKAKEREKFPSLINFIV
jgi:hypothetical protein